jgi:hypothetical protein
VRTEASFDVTTIAPSNPICADSADQDHLLDLVRFLRVLRDPHAGKLFFVPFALVLPAALSLRIARLLSDSGARRRVEFTRPGASDDATRSDPCSSVFIRGY